MSLAEQMHEGERRAWTGERGALTFIRLREEVVLIVLEGKLDDEAAAAWHEHYPWVTSGTGKLLIFIDGAAVTFPSTAFIAAGTATAARTRSRTEHIHVLVSGGLVEMIAKTANLTLGGLMIITRERERFEQQLTDALR